MTQPSPWLRGPVEGVHRDIMPVAHALVDAREEIERSLDGLSAEELRARPGGAASVEFHVRHISGSVNRLLTYARGRQLDEEQRRSLAAEKEEGSAGPELVTAAREAIGGALQFLRDTPPELFHERRAVGGAQLPSTVFEILHHIAAHTQRHVGQLVTTVKILRGSRQ